VTDRELIAEALAEYADPTRYKRAQRMAESAFLDADWQPHADVVLAALAAAGRHIVGKEFEDVICRECLRRIYRPEAEPRYWLGTSETVVNGVRGRLEEAYTYPAKAELPSEAKYWVFIPSPDTEEPKQ
jgi:hypothetical protein